MINLKQELKEVVDEECHNGKFDGEVDVEEFQEKPHFEMRTCLETKTTELKYNPEFEEKKPNKTKIVIRDGSRHEIDHHVYLCQGLFKGCPRNLDTHVKLIYEPIANVLVQKGFTDKDCHYVANALEDTIIHADLSNGFSLDGISLFFEDIGENQNEKKFTDFYEAHVKLNMFLWGNKQQKKQLRRFYKHDEKVKNTLENFLKRTEVSKIEEEIEIYERRKELIKEDGSKEIIERKDKKGSTKNRKRIRSYLNNEQNWPEIARVYAEEFSKLMQPGYALHLFNHSGRGTKGQEKQETEEEQEGNEFDKQMHSKEFKMRRIQEAHNEKQKTPIWMERQEALDLLYQSMARKLYIKAQTYTETSSMPICWYGTREFNEEKDNFKHIKFGLNDKGEIVLKKKRFHEVMPLEIKIHQKGFPKVKFGLLDVSPSMFEDLKGGGNIGNISVIHWGDNSKYHYALLAEYGVLEYLRQNSLLSYSGIGVGLFSDETIVVEGLAEVKNAILNPKIGTTTELELEKIIAFFEGHGNLIWTISDGEVFNWGEIEKEFVRKAKNHNYFHLQFGKSTTMTKSLEKNGFYVGYAKEGIGLVNEAIDLTDRILRQYK